MKRMFMLILALLLAVSMVTPAFAQEIQPLDAGTGTGDGSIEIDTSGVDYYDADDEALITGHSYTVFYVYRIMDLTYTDADDDGKPDEGAAYAYTVAKKWESFFETGGLGASYFVEKTAATAADTTYNSLTTIVFNGKTYYVNITESNAEDFTNDAMTYAMSYDSDDSQYNVWYDGIINIDAEDGTGTIEDLPLGYYLVYGAGLQRTDDYGCVCSLTNTVPDAKITPKGQLPGIEKLVDGVKSKSVDQGDTVTFTVTTKVLDTSGYEDNGGVFGYYIYDFGYGYDVDVDTLEIKVDGSEVNCVEKQMTDLCEAADSSGYHQDLEYNASYYPDNKDWWYAYSDENDMEVGELRIQPNLLNWQDKVGKTITITYDATATIYDDDMMFHTQVNLANLVYDECANMRDPVASGDTGVLITSYAETWFNDIIVTKTDDSDEPLAGAKFVLMNGDGEYLLETRDGDGNITEIEWVEVSGTATNKFNLSVTDADVSLLKQAVEDEDITVKTSDGDGELKFEGVKDGTYYLVEIETIEGYNLLAEATSVTVAGEAEEGWPEPYGDLEKFYMGTEEEITVVNRTGTILPSTGGMGVTVFYISGAVLAAAAMAWAIKRRRMSRT